MSSDNREKGRKWSVFVYRYTNPNHSIVVYADDESQVESKALHELEVLGIRDCERLVVEFEITKPKRGIADVLNKFGKLLRSAVNAIGK